MTRNLPSLREIAEGRTLADLGLDEIDALMTEAEAENKVVSAAKRNIQAHLAKAFTGQISSAFKAKSADFGTVHVDTGAYDLEITVPKKVEWDQTQLAGIRASIADHGDSPDEYVKTTLTVDERAYTAWPATIRTVFDAARTVKPGPMTIKLAKKEPA